MAKASIELVKRTVSLIGLLAALGLLIESLVSKVG